MKLITPKIVAAYAALVTGCSVLMAGLVWLKQNYGSWGVTSWLFTR